MKTKTVRVKYKVSFTDYIYLNEYDAGLGYDDFQALLETDTTIEAILKKADFDFEKDHIEIINWDFV